MAAGIEMGDLNWLALSAAMASNIVLGFLWYAPQLPTGRIWMRDMKLPKGFKPTPQQMTVSIILMLIGTFLLMFVLQHVFLAFRDAFRIDGERLPGTDAVTYVDGLMGGFFTWLGFFLPVGLSSVAWEMRPWSLFLVNTSYYLVSLLVAGTIFAAMM